MARYFSAPELAESYGDFPLRDALVSLAPQERQAYMIGLIQSISSTLTLNLSVEAYERKLLTYTEILFAAVADEVILPFLAKYHEIPKVHEKEYGVWLSTVSTVENKKGVTAIYLWQRFLDSTVPGAKDPFAKFDSIVLHTIAKGWASVLNDVHAEVFFKVMMSIMTHQHYRFVLLDCLRSKDITPSAGRIASSFRTIDPHQMMVNLSHQTPLLRALAHMYVNSAPLNKLISTIHEALCL